MQPFWFRPRRARCFPRLAMALAPNASRGQLPDSDVVVALRPFPPSALGWFCLGYNLSDAPGRVSTIVDLLRRSSVAAPRAITPQEVSRGLRPIPPPCLGGVSDAAWTLVGILWTASQGLLGGSSEAA